MPDPINALDHPICLAPLEWLAPSAWMEHTPFAMWLTAVHRPRVLVELGSHFGTSYCSFCQAIDALGLPTRSFAIDTWEGDAHTGGYARNVLDDLRRHHDPRYFRFSTLLQSTFDEAQPRFADGEIDLLHIDGYHTYEAVRHDFDTWRPKVSDRGLVLFHDIEEREGDFGVWRLWEELTSEYRGFRFVHEHGLGVLAVGEDLPDEVRALLDLQDEEAERLRSFFSAMGRRLRLQYELERTVADRDYYRAEREAFAAERVGIVAEREALRADRDAAVAEREALRADRDALRDEWDRTLAALRATEGELSTARGEWQEFRSSQSWRVFHQMYRLGTRIGPLGSRRRRALKGIGRLLEVLGREGAIGFTRRQIRKAIDPRGVPRAHRPGGHPWDAEALVGPGIAPGAPPHLRPANPLAHTTDRTAEACRRA